MADTAWQAAIYAHGIVLRVLITNLVEDDAERARLRNICREAVEQAYKVGMVSASGHPILQGALDEVEALFLQSPEGQKPRQDV